MKRLAVVAVVTALLYFPAANAGSPPGSQTYTGCLDTAGKGKGKISKLQLGSTPIGGSCSSGFSQITVSGGDITQVTAGTGLNGGASAGDATLSIATPYQLPQMCSEGEIPRWEAMNQVWSCSTDIDTDTTGGSQGVAFRAFKNGMAQGLDGPTTDGITLQTENFDTGSDFSSSFFTAPVSGIYRFEGRVELTNVTGGTFYAGIGDSMITFCRGSLEVVNGTAASVVDCLIELNVGSSVFLTATVTEDGLVSTGSDVTFLSGTLVS
jgi:hypothetical protein